jgi:hypothetical protein
MALDQSKIRKNFILVNLDDSLNDGLEKLAANTTEDSWLIFVAIDENQYAVLKAQYLLKLTEYKPGAIHRTFSDLIASDKQKSFFSIVASYEQNLVSEAYAIKKANRNTARLIVIRQNKEMLGYFSDKQMGLSNGEELEVNSGSSGGGLAPMSRPLEAIQNIILSLFSVHDTARHLEPPAPPVPERYANLWFTERREPESRINKYTALVQQQEIFLLFFIGPFDLKTILKDAKPFPSQDVIEQAFPELAGKPIPLDVTFFSQDFETPLAERTHKLTLERCKPTEICYFPVKPSLAGLARGRVCIFYKNHLLQALNIQATVAPAAQVLDQPHLAQVEMTFSANFEKVERFPERGLWLGLNQNVDGSHTLNIKDSQVALSCRQGDTLIQNALIQARNNLSEVSFTLEDKKINGIVQKDPITNQPIKEKVYRFYQDNSPKGNSPKRFIDDLKKLADVGSSLYYAVFGKPPPAEDKDAVENSRNAVKKALEKPCVIQVCRLKEMADIWPWAVMYDLDLDIDNVKEVCERFHTDDKSIVPYAACIQNCPHRDAVTAQMNTNTVICPYGFWGFKHIIEQPVQPGGKKAFEDLVLDIKLPDKPVLEMPVETGLLKQEEVHITNMKNLKFTVLDRKQDILSALNSKSQPAPPEPQIVYFFCHGGYDDRKNPMLAVGQNERLRPMELDGKLDWQQSHGLVFINGCHTAELTPDALANIMWPFVNGGAGGIIGTEITVDTYLACPFAVKFFDYFLSDDPKTKHKVGEIIQEIRLEFLAMRNPLGLVYTPYCSADLHLER